MTAMLAFIRTLSDSQLAEYCDALESQIKRCRAYRREYTSLRGVLQCAKLAQINRQRRARLQKAMDKMDDLYDWQKRADLQ